MLECGHTACKKCAVDSQIFECNYQNCKRLILIKDESALKSVKSIEGLIQSNFKELYEKNVQEYSEILKTIQGIFIFLIQN